MAGDEKDGTHLPWNEGLPTSPDVTAIQQKWPDLKVGDRITYRDISELLKIDWRSNRFKSVTSAWRKRELETGKVIDADPGSSFYVASAEQNSSKTYGVLRHIGRKARKQRRFLSVSHTDNPVLANTIAHQGQLMLATEREARKSRMNLLPSTKAAEAPRIEPPKEKKS